MADTGYFCFLLGPTVNRKSFVLAWQAFVAGNGNLKNLFLDGQPEWGRIVSGCCDRLVGQDVRDFLAAVRPMDRLGSFVDKGQVRFFLIDSIYGDDWVEVKG